jgi:hypothetical protein
MAHYAYINENNIVVEVITGRDENDLVENISDWELFYTSQRAGLKAVQTSYNTHNGVHVNGGSPLRKNFAGIGYFYDEERDAFIPPKRFNSWVLNEESCTWEPPSSYPVDGGMYMWDETTLSWVLADDAV